MLDEVVAVTGWSRDNARRRLTAAAMAPPGPGRAVATTVRKPRASKFSYDARKVLCRSVARMRSCALRLLTTEGPSRVKAQAWKRLVPTV